MKFFFPDSSDLVDPTFDFVRETRSPDRIRQRDDLYAHESFDVPPFNGILVSMSIADGKGGANGRYTIAQRQRLLRDGVKKFFRLERTDGGPDLVTMGDCGAFSYSREKYPPYTVQSVIDFYAECDFDLGISVDHVILGFDAKLDSGLPGLNVPPPAWSERQEITIQLADEFIRAHREQKHRFEPVGVAQGWSPDSYAHSVTELQKMGYSYIAVGGVVPLKTNEILASLEAIDAVRKPETRLHLLGVTRISEVQKFARMGVVSFDSTSPLRQAFKDEKDNYYTLDRTYPAIRVPQIDANPKLQKRIASGEIDHEIARKLEKACRNALIKYDQELCSIDEVMAPLSEYDQLCDGRVDRTEAYREVLEVKPWKNCSCNVCKQLGIHVILFRGAERNRRRGFHNLYVFYQRLHRELGLPSSVD